MPEPANPWEVVVINKRNLLTGIGLALTLGVAPLAAFAFPNGQVTIIVPYSAGGPTDVAARILADEISDTLGVPVIVENRPGAGTVIGADAVKNAPADGQTIFITAATTFSSNPHMIKDISYGLSDFAPIGMIARVPFAFVVNNGFPTDNIEEFVAYAKAEPGRVTTSTLGPGSVPDIVVGMMEQSLGIEFTRIPYSGAAPVLTDILGGHLDSYVSSVAQAGPLHAEKSYKVLALLTSDRVDQLDGVPTFTELGYPDLIADSWFAAFAPAGTPADVLETLNGALTAAVESDAFQEQMKNAGNIPMTASVQETTDFVTSEYNRWGELIKSMGLLPQ